MKDKTDEDEEEEEAKSSQSSDYAYEDVPNYKSARDTQPNHLRKSFSMQNWRQKFFNKLTKEKKDRVVLVDSAVPPTTRIDQNAAPSKQLDNPILHVMKFIPYKKRKKGGYSSSSSTTEENDTDFE